MKNTNDERKIIILLLEYLMSEYKNDEIINGLIEKYNKIIDIESIKQKEIDFFNSIDVEKTKELFINKKSILIDSINEKLEENKINVEVTTELLFEQLFGKYSILNITDYDKKAIIRTALTKLIKNGTTI